MIYNLQPVMILTLIPLAFFIDGNQVYYLFLLPFTIIHSSVFFVVQSLFSSLFICFFLRHSSCHIKKADSCSGLVSFIDNTCIDTDGWYTCLLTCDVGVLIGLSHLQSHTLRLWGHQSEWAGGVSPRNRDNRLPSFRRLSF